MKVIISFLIIVLFFSCKPTPEKKIPKKINWENRIVELPAADSLIFGRSYLSVYSEIYDFVSEEITHQLTATVSIRNLSLNDSVYIRSADYYNTQGKLIRSYIKKPVYVSPMETLEIIIAYDDDEGGTGANFNFNWAIKKNSEKPLFEAVMIWTTGYQGISFTTYGVNL